MRILGPADPVPRKNDHRPKIAEGRPAAFPRIEKVETEAISNSNPRDGPGNKGASQANCGNRAGNNADLSPVGFGFRLLRRLPGCADRPCRCVPLFYRMWWQKALS